MTWCQQKKAGLMQHIYTLSIKPAKKRYWRIRSEARMAGAEVIKYAIAQAVVDAAKLL